MHCVQNPVLAGKWLAQELKSQNGIMSELLKECIIPAYKHDKNILYTYLI
jgi:hypothetical protein